MTDNKKTVGVGSLQAALKAFCEQDSKPIPTCIKAVVNRQANWLIVLGEFHG